MDPRWLGFSIVTLGIGVYIGSLIGLWVRNNRDERRWRREFGERHFQPPKGKANRG